jgi:hypothetical protein
MGFIRIAWLGSGCVYVCTCVYVKSEGSKDRTSKRNTSVREEDNGTRKLTKISTSDSKTELVSN